MIQLKQYHVKITQYIDIFSLPKDMQEFFRDYFSDDEYPVSGADGDYYYLALDKAKNMSFRMEDEQDEDWFWNLDQEDTLNHYFHMITMFLDADVVKENRVGIYIWH